MPKAKTKAGNTAQPEADSQGAVVTVEERQELVEAVQDLLTVLRPMVAKLARNYRMIRLGCIAGALLTLTFMTGAVILVWKLALQ